MFEQGLTKHVDAASERREYPRIPALVLLIHERIDGGTSHKEEKNIRQVFHCNVIIFLGLILRI